MQTFLKNVESAAARLEESMKYENYAINGWWKMRGFEDWTLEDVKKHNERIAKISSNDHLLDIGKMVQVKNKKSKYGAKKVEIQFAPL